MPLRVDDFDAENPQTSAREWRRRLAAGEPMIGLWVASSSPTAAEILGASGADWIIIDAEHSPNPAHAIVEQLRGLAAAPVFTVVRAPSQSPLELGRLLDLGAPGLMVPMVESAEQARAVVAATRYPPRGHRGVGGGFARATRWTGIGDYLTRAESTFSVIVQIETVAAIARLEEILEVDGIDGAFVGPADLAASMGLLGQPRHPQVRAKVAEAVKVIVSRAAVAGVNAFALDDARYYRSLGAQLLAVGADVTILGSGAAGLVAEMRAPAGLGGAEPEPSHEKEQR